MSSYEDIGRQIAALREGRGWSQSQLADVSSLHLRTVQRAEHGRCRPETLMALAGALDVDVRDLHLAGLPTPRLTSGVAGHDEALVQRPSLLARIASGKALLDLIARGVSWQFDHGVLAGEDAEVVANLFQATQGYGCLYPELQPGERVRASAALHERVLGLEQRGLIVLGAVENRPLLLKPGHSIPRPVAVIVVQRPVTERPEKSAKRRHA